MLKNLGVALFLALSLAGCAGTGGSNTATMGAAGTSQSSDERQAEMYSKAGG